ncbi:MAG: MFS transporter [Nitrospirae bacterium]|nr:MAG: MFS transporter [Nitrospirota bacterium]
MDPAETRSFNLKALLILSLGHLVTDIYQGALPAIMPFLKERLSLTYSMAGVIILASNIASSVIQPLFGMISDKKEKPLLIPVGCLISGIGFCLIPFMSQYAVIVSLVVVSGLGIAAFHPEGFRTAHRFTGARAAAGMSIFSLGGNLGFALGPVLSLLIVTRLGFSYLPGMIVFAFLFLAALSFLWKTLAVPERPEEEHPLTGQKGTGNGFPPAMVILLGTVIIRSCIHAGLTSYIPFYYIDYLKGDPVYAGKLVSFFLLGGVVGTVTGAPLADRWGHKRYLVVTMLMSSCILPLILFVKGIMLSAVLAVFGMVLISTFTVTIVMAQRLLPKNLGVASGLMVGFAIGTGGIGVMLLGVLADNFGVPVALKSITLLPIAGFLLSLMVRYPDRQA